MKGADAIAQVLKAEGVDFITCFPASELIDPVYRSGIRTILVRQERAAVDIDNGYSRVSNGTKIGVCTMQEGVGIENSFAGVAQAYADSVPLLLLPGQYDQHRIGIYPNFFDAINAYKTLTKWVDRINLVDRIPGMMRRAFTSLRSGRLGPIVLEVPEDVARAEFSGELNYRKTRGYRMAPDPHDVEVAARAILQAKNPIMHIGEGVLYAQAWEELLEFAELTQIPVMTTLKGKSAFPEDHPLSLGYGGCSATAMVNQFLSSADLVFSLGSSLTSWWLAAPIPTGKVIVQSTIDEYDINKDYACDYAVMGDAKLVLQRLIAEIKEKSLARHANRDLADRIAKTKEEWLKKWMPNLTSNEIPINPYRVIWDLMHTLDPKKTIVTHDSGYPRDELAPFYVSTSPRGYLGWGNATTLGFSLGASMGAKLAEPEKTVVNVIGDAAIGMTGMDFETAVREKIPILTVVLNNSVMSGFNEVSPSTYRLSGKYADFAEAMGGYGEFVSLPDEISPAIRRAQKAMASGKPALLNIVTKEEPAQTKYW